MSDVALDAPRAVRSGEELPTEELAYTPVPRFRSGPDPADVEKTISLILAAKRPVLLVGQGIHHAEAWNELRA